jgi:hypothetical protein
VCLDRHSTRPRTRRGLSSPLPRLMSPVQFACPLLLSGSTVERALSPARQPCRYFMAGFCARSDCTVSLNSHTQLSK